MLRRSTPFEKRLGYRFRHPGLLRAALTHRSYAHEAGDPATVADPAVETHYERLEFLGDAVLGMLVAEWLFTRHPDRPEGDLSKLKSHLVSRPVLARHATTLGLGGELRLGVGEERSGGREKASLLADVWEAILGAVYLDSGLSAAAGLVHPMLEAAEDRKAASAQGAPADAKTRLQEEVQGRGWKLPVYELVGSTGPDHDKTFQVHCRIGGEVRGEGEGRSKKRAEQRAAAAALQTLRQEGSGL